MRRFLGLLVAVAFIPGVCPAATTVERVEAAAKDGKYTYVMFYRANDTATKRMASTIESHVSDNDDKTTWVTVNVRDRKQASLVKRFDASRMPLPAVFGLAPNGAVTGVYPQTVNNAQLTEAILTPKYADMIMALQNQKIAVVSLLPSAGTPIPFGAEALLSNPDFKGKTHAVQADATEPAEADFFRRMHVDTNLTKPVVLIFTPPGTHLGTFDATVTAEELTEKLHKSGKCTCSKCQQKAKK